MHRFVHHPVQTDRIDTPATERKVKRFVDITEDVGVGASRKEGAEGDLLSYNRWGIPSFHQTASVREGNRNGPVLARPGIGGVSPALRKRCRAGGSIN